MKMKLIISIALLFLLGSCNNDKKAIQTILSGVLPDQKNESVSLVPIKDYFPGLKLNDSFPTVETDSLGRFTFRFTTANLGFYQVVSNNYHQLHADVYLEPGDSLFIEQSSWTDNPKFLITGKGSEKLKYLEKDYLAFPEAKSFYDKIRSDSFSSELNFKRFIDSIHFARLDAFSSFKDIPDFLKVYHLNTLKAERADFLLDHLERRNYYMKEEFDYFYPDTSYLNFLDSIIFDNDFSQTTAARSFTSVYMNYIARKAFKSKPDEEWWQDNMGYKLEFIAGQSKSLWTDLLALSSIKEYSFGLMTNDFFNDLDKFNSGIQHKFFSSENQMLFQLNAKPYEQLAPGKFAPDFELPDSSGKLIRLSDLKGSIVYIDFWGTWCYPCIQEIPDALKLQEKYKGQPVTFLYVALEYDSANIAGWKKFIAGKNSESGKQLNGKPFPGVHLVAEKQFRNKSISAYKLNFAPTHVLIDQNGKIVKVRAKSPKDIHEEIDELLKAMKR